MLWGSPQGSICGHGSELLYALCPHPSFSCSLASQLTRTNAPAIASLRPHVPQGLYHSGTPGNEYGDCTCAMGNCGVGQCYNAAQSWELVSMGSAGRGPLVAEGMGGARQKLCRREVVLQGGGWVVAGEHILSGTIHGRTACFEQRSVEFNDVLYGGIMAASPSSSLMPLLQGWAIPVDELGEAVLIPGRCPLGGQNAVQDGFPDRCGFNTGHGVSTASMA